MGDDGVAVNVKAGSVMVTTSGVSWLLLDSDEPLIDDKVTVMVDSATVTTLAYPSLANPETLVSEEKMPPKPVKVS